MSSCNSDWEYDLSASRVPQATTPTPFNSLKVLEHQLRTKIHGILGLTGIMLEEPPGGLRPHLLDLKDSAESLMVMMSNLLDHPQRVEDDLAHQEAFAFSEWVEDTVALLMPSALAHGTELDCLIRPGVPGSVLGNAQRLRQILYNFISYGLGCCGGSEILVHVEAVPMGAARFKVHFTVSVARSGDDFLDLAEGHGENCHAAKRREEMEYWYRWGDIWVKSLGGESWREVGGANGDSIHFTLVFEETACVGKQLRAADLSLLEGKRVLLVDDNETNLWILNWYLKPLGMYPVSARDGREALLLFDHGECFDLALLDYQMPGMNGFELAEAIRGRAGQSKLPMILLSSGDSHQKPEGPAVFGEILPKPIRRMALIESICRLLKKPQPAVPAIQD